jgi:hypothetical protein
MTLAEQARNQAITLEAKKDALSQRQSGDWKVSFTVQSIDMDPRLTQAPMGTRYAVVLVEIGDDELPVQKEVRAELRQVSPKPDGAKRMDWREVQPAAQAGIRCGDPVFWAFLQESGYITQDADEAAAAVRAICVVKSRSEFSSDHRKRVLWHQLDSQFQAWQLRERVGA